MSSPPQMTVIRRELEKGLSDDGRIKTMKKRRKNMHLKKAQSFPMSQWDCLQPFHN